MNKREGKIKLKIIKWYLLCFYRERYSQNLIKGFLEFQIYQHILLIIPSNNVKYCQENEMFQRILAIRMWVLIIQVNVQFYEGYLS